MIDLKHCIVSLKHVRLKNKVQLQYKKKKKIEIIYIQNNEQKIITLKHRWNKQMNLIKKRNYPHNSKLQLYFNFKGKCITPLLLAYIRLISIPFSSSVS